MSKELVIGSNRHETKVAILEDDQLVEVYFQRANEYSLAGSIHKGRVTRVLPGMQSAFVDLGLERDTFLYVSDFFEEHDDIDTVAEEKPARVDSRDRDRDRDRGRGREPERRSEAVAEPVDISAGRQEPIAAPPAMGPVEDLEAIPAEAPVLGGVRDNRRGDRPDSDPRGGDRRGRRSRRSRSRGRGFPDNKYAQPTSASPAVYERAPSERISSRIDDEPPGDVTILPGESLAKYRRASTAPVAERPRASAQFEEEPFPLRAAEEEGQSFRQDLGIEDPPTEEEAQETAEEIAARVDELELADAVLSHHPEEIEEETLKPEAAEVPSSAAVEQVIVEIEAVDPEEVSELEPTAGHAAFDENDEPDHSHLMLAQELAEEGPDDEELETLSGPFLVSSEEVIEFEAGEAEAADLDDVLELNAGAPQVETGPVGEGGPAAAGQSQTAEVREQGGRYMHRMSRRMRRRRGGNRSNDRNSDASGPEGAAPVPAVGPAVSKAEPKPEVRVQEAREEISNERPDRVLPSISDLLKAGQEIIVQIAKEPLGQKGARITSHIALPGRFVVFMPSVNHLGVSRKIASDEERQRLKKILQAHRVGTSGGFIVRTAGEGVPEDEIAADMNFLYSLWLDIRQKAEKKPAPVLLHYDLDIVQRILRDQVTDEFKAIWVDNEDLYENILGFIQRFQPGLVGRVKMYTRSAPIFDAFNITQELEKALRPKVWLKSGGYIVINQTEALVAIDINTGKYVGRSNRLEDTIVKTNTEAVKEIVRQIRLRDLGGIIVVDFIDMDERKNRQKVMQALEEAMRADKAPYKILQFNDFGLVAITRKRVKQSLERTLCSPCPYCEGAGYVKSVQTIVSEILVEAQKIARAIEGKDVVLRVHPEVAKVLKANSNRYLEELEEVLGRPVLVAGDPNLHHERFDLA